MLPLAETYTVPDCRPIEDEQISRYLVFYASVIAAKDVSMRKSRVMQWQTWPVVGSGCWVVICSKRAASAPSVK